MFLWPLICSEEVQLCQLQCFLSQRSYSPGIQKPVATASFNGLLADSFKTLTEIMLFSGIDVEHVNVVINYDCPRDSNTYLHRIARAGRFGTKGLTATFVSTEADSNVMNEVQDRFDINIDVFPDEVDPELYMS